MKNENQNIEFNSCATKVFWNSLQEVTIGAFTLLHGYCTMGEKVWKTSYPKATCRTFAHYLGFYSQRGMDT